MNERLKKTLNTSGDWVSNFLILGLALLVLAWLASPARSAEACTYTFDGVMEDFAINKAIVPSMPEPVIIAPEDLPVFKKGAEALGVSGAERATRGFLHLREDGVMLLGLEVDGCLSAPIPLPREGGVTAPLPKLDSPRVNA